jgi:hypothetical protein
MPTRPEVTGRDVGVGAAIPPLTPQQIWVELQRIVDMKEASRLSGLSHDSLQRHHKDKIVHMSERRVGMRLRDALLLADDE